MANDVAGDQFVIIRIEGMHCHTCEQTIQRALSSKSGVREVEVDFASGQASVLFGRASTGVASTSVNDLIDAINDAGYRATGFTQGQTGQTSHPTAHPDQSTPETSAH